MKSQWIIHKLNPQLPSRISSLIPSLQTPYPNTSKHTLNHVNISHLLSICGTETYSHLGYSIHASIIKNPELSDPNRIETDRNAIIIWNSLLSFWNSMIAAFARHGDASRALQLYERMTIENVKPTDVTFLSLLHACSHVGLVRKGMEFVKSMTEKHGITPRTEHYACIVDMLGRAGFINEAKQYIEGLPVKPDVLVWQALLGACGIHGDVEIGKHAAEKLFLASPESPAPYVLMANIYSFRGVWKERARTIKKMKEMRVSKEIGISWIEVEKEVHSFVVEDRMHPDADTIFRVLGELVLHMTDEGYVPNKRFILYFLDEDNEPG